jgi:hypothetical protein
MKKLRTVNEMSLIVNGTILKTAKLTDEYYVPLADPKQFIEALRKLNTGADLFTFVQELDDRAPKHHYHCELDEMAVLPVTTYEHWLNKQITFKPRNKLRKAWKAGVETRKIEFSDSLVKGIMALYNETPIRQGKKNWHFGKDKRTVKMEHATFLDRSEFIGAYWKEELIGFAKVTHSANYSIIMNIVGSIAHRDKAPTNALIAKTIELVAAKKIGLLNYGVWGRRGLNDFKTASAFECYKIPRYYVPLTLKGKVALKMKVHTGIKERLPEGWISRAADLRAKWNQRRYQKTSNAGPIGAKEIVSAEAK